jgi:hypothetical protein
MLIRHISSNSLGNVCLSVCLSGCVCLCPDTFGGNILWAINLFSAHNALLCACVLNASAYMHSLIFERILSTFVGNILRLTTSGKVYILFRFMHRAHACERACGREHVIKHSLIYGRILFKFAVNVLQIITSWMGCIFVMFTQCALRVHERACTSTHARARVHERARG